MNHGFRFATLLAIGTLVAGLELRAGTIEVSVEERGAGPVPDQVVALYPVTPQIQVDPLYFFNTRPAGRCSTGPTGRCQISGLRVALMSLFSFRSLIRTWPRR